MKLDRTAVLVLLGIMVLLAYGCAGSTASQSGETTGSNPAAKTSTARQPVEGSHADRTYIAPTPILPQYRAVYIAPPAMDTTATRDEKVNDFLSQLENTIRSSVENALRNSRKFDLVTSNEQEAKAKGRYLVLRNDVLVHFGSTAARFLVGMGAGRSKLIVVPSLDDPSTQDVLLKYTGWGGAAGGTGSQILDKMRVDGTAIEQYFVGLIK
jgi:hypothetical protein